MLETPGGELPHCNPPRTAPIPPTGGGDGSPGHSGSEALTSPPENLISPQPRERYEGRRACSTPVSSVTVPLPVPLNVRPPAPLLEALPVTCLASHGLSLFSCLTRHDGLCSTIVLDNDDADRPVAATPYLSNSRAQQCEGVSVRRCRNLAAVIRGHATSLLQ